MMMYRAQSPLHVMSKRGLQERPALLAELLQILDERFGGRAPLILHLHVHVGENPCASFREAFANFMVVLRGG